MGLWTKLFGPPKQSCEVELKDEQRQEKYPVALISSAILQGLLARPSIKEACLSLNGAKCEVGDTHHIMLHDGDDTRLVVLDTFLRTRAFIPPALDRPSNVGMFLRPVLNEIANRLEPCLTPRCALVSRPTSGGYSASCDGLAITCKENPDGELYFEILFGVIPAA